MLILSGWLFLFFVNFRYRIDVNIFTLEASVAAECENMFTVFSLVVLRRLNFFRKTKVFSFVLNSLECWNETPDVVTWFTQIHTLMLVKTIKCNVDKVLRWTQESQFIPNKQLRIHQGKEYNSRGEKTECPRRDLNQDIRSVLYSSRHFFAVLCIEGLCIYSTNNKIHILICHYDDQYLSTLHTCPSLVDNQNLFPAIVCDQVCQSLPQLRGAWVKVHGHGLSGHDLTGVQPHFQVRDLKRGAHGVDVSCDSFRTRSEYCHRVLLYLTAHWNTAKNFSLSCHCALNFVSSIFAIVKLRERGIEEKKQREDRETEKKSEDN